MAKHLVEAEKKILAHIAARLSTLRLKLEAMGDDDRKYADLRARIHELKQLVTYIEAEPNE